ncbi:MAG: TIGR00266 family protein [Flavobacteriales bacterium]|nr:TIGR00266 family protein [Flavobacteriales bacterium]|tara:strand:+ start:280 stop:960 length:681 start_codon:yes stop_codon:yes gene_type:complete
MQIDIQMGPGSSAAKVSLEPGEILTAEGGAMIAMSGDMSMTTTTHKKKSGGIMKALKRVISGESFFMNHYEPGPNGGDVFLSTALPGDMKVMDLNGQGLIVQGGSYVASSHDINVDFSWQGFKSAFSGEGLFWLNINGIGKVVVNSFGAIYPIEVNGEYIVDTGHIVAFDETLNFKISKAGKSLVSSFLGGEGLVCKFNGKGTVWCQSHNDTSFGKTVGPKLKPRK